MQKRKNLKNLFCISAVIYLILYMLLRPQTAIDAVRRALTLCANVLVPSLFPFFVFSGLLIGFGFANMLSRPMSHIMRPLFGVSGSGALCLTLGVISGYPLGASCICDMYKSGALTKSDAEKLLAFCNNSGPLFIIGSVGAAMYGSGDIGVMLYAVHILSALSVGLVFSLFGRKGRYISSEAPVIQCTKPIGAIVKETIANSVKNMLTVCGFTIVFAVIISSLSAAGGNIFSLASGGLIEISTGVYNVSISPLSLSHKLIMTSAIAGFAGISVHLQVTGIVSGTGLDTKRYFLGKSLQAVFAALYTAAVLNFMPVAAYAPIMPIRPEALIDFGTAMKLSVLYMASAVLVMLLTFLFEKIYIWKKKIKYGKLK